MDAKNRRFQLGDFECLLVNDGTFTYQHADQLLFINAPKDRLKPLLSPVAQASAAVVPRPAAVGRPVTPSHTACFQQLHNPGHPKNLTLRVTLGVGGPHCELPFDL